MHPSGTISRRSASIALAAALLSTTSARAWPGPDAERPIRLVVPFGPGGTSDMLARLLRGPLAQQLGRPVLVENRAGAGGARGAEWVARAAPDGLTLGIATQSSHAAHPALNPGLRYDPLRDFAPISMLAVVPGVLAVHPSVPAGTMHELIALAQHNPGKLSYGTPGIGSMGHLLMAQFEQLHRLELVHVPYSSGYALLVDALAGQLQVVGDSLMSALPHLRARKLRPLAVLATHRVAALPDVPTYAELGFGQIGRPAWFGLVAPAGTPAEVLERLGDAVRSSMKQPEIVATLEQSGAAPAPSTADEFTGAMRTTLQGLREVVAARNIRIE